MTLTRIHHVGMVVSDADAALGFWRDVLGLSVARDEVVEDQGVRGVLLPLANCELELIQPVQDDTGVSRYLAEQGEGLHHVCFESTDVQADLTEAETRGMELIDRVPRAGLAGQIGFIHPKSTHGVLVELAQPPAGAAPAGAAAGEAWTPRRLHHAVCAMHDRDVAGRDFMAQFGLTDGGRNEFPEAGLCNWFLDLGDTQLELVTPLTENERDPLVRRLQRGEGMFMLALSVGDVEQAVERLRGAGVTCTDASAAMPVTYLSPKHTFGVRVALDAG